jgi:uncharacterized membrane protein YGL010W
MKNGIEQLTKYAHYHRDKRNILTHFVGVPMIVLAVVILLSRPALNAGFSTLQITPALLLALIAAGYYVLLDFKLGMVMVTFLAFCLGVASATATMTTSQWLMAGLGLFVMGWVIQFVGHYFEGKKPAFVDDIMGLLIGPLFVAAEIAFLLRMRKDLQAPIEAQAGPTRINNR